MADAAAVDTGSRAPAVALAAVPKPQRVFGWSNIRRQPRFLIGGTFIGLLILIAICAPFIVRTDPKVSHPADANQRPSIHHLSGTDDLGRDVLGRVIYGARVSLAVGIIAVSIGLGLGVTLGMTAGYNGGIADLLILRCIDALGQEYTRVARAKGLAERSVVIRHALKNAFIPFVTVVGLQVGAVLEGAFITEQIFLWPGVGLLAVDSIGGRDYPVVQGIVLISALSFMAVNLIVDVLYAFLDPRIKYG